MSTHRSVLFALPAVLSLLTAACAAAPSEQQPVVQKLSELDGRLLRIERIMTNQSLLDLSQRLENLENEQRVLRGQIDEIKYANDNAGNQQRELYADLDKRLQALEAGSAAMSSTLQGRTAGGFAGQAANPGTNPGNYQGADKTAYQAAFEQLKNNKYPESAQTFQQFLSKYPDSPLADNAQYWLGEAHYVMKDYPQALRDFQTVSEKYPSSRKIPDALLKVGYCNYELKNYKDARVALNQLVQQYADSAAAPLASQRLAKMESEQH